MNRELRLVEENLRLFQENTLLKSRKLESYRSVATQTDSRLLNFLIGISEWPVWSAFGKVWSFIRYYFLWDKRLGEDDDANGGGSCYDDCSAVCGGVPSSSSSLLNGGGGAASNSGPSCHLACSVFGVGCVMPMSGYQSTFGVRFEEGVSDSVDDDVSDGSSTTSSCHFLPHIRRSFVMRAGLD
jgi:hypothetical protein